MNNKVEVITEFNLGRNILAPIAQLGRAADS